MNMWTQDELDTIAKTDELKISSLKEDGTLTKPVIIWVVRVGNDVFVRSYKGREKGIWFRNTQLKKQGHVSVGGIEKDVTFVDVSNDENLNKNIDTEYNSKYHHYGAYYVDPVLTPEARAATLKLVPR